MFKNFYFDALTHDPRATRHLLQMIGSDRVVLGTDSPFDMGEERPVQHLDAVPGLTDTERENVSYRTAATLFGDQY
jgi:aminocarboxymuconate-semialdehyde decarboxylase